MAFDDGLAQRVRSLLGRRADADEREMFGGVAFLISGNMCCGILGEELIVRLDREQAGELLESAAGTRPFDVTGRPMRGWLFVEPQAIAEDADLEAWVRRAEAFAANLPPK